MANHKNPSVPLEIAQLGHPIIRSKALPIDNVADPTLQHLIDGMIATCEKVDGVGLAAPQIYKSLRVFILASHPNPRYPNAPLMQPTAIINPKIITFSDSTMKDWEGCLSIPGIRGLVPRYESIETEYTTRDGKRIKEHFSGFVARIFQHEHDHLEGIVFLDRVQSTRDLVTEKEYQKLISTKMQ